MILFITLENKKNKIATIITTCNPKSKTEIQVRTALLVAIQIVT